MIPWRNLMPTRSKPCDIFLGTLLCEKSLNALTVTVVILCRTRLDSPLYYVPAEYVLELHHRRRSHYLELQTSEQSCTFSSLLLAVSQDFSNAIYTIYGFEPDLTTIGGDSSTGKCSLNYHVGGQSASRVDHVN
jgi:hypothetical protein